MINARTPEPRLPLLYEFQGICHAGETNIDPEHRFRYCNRGNAKGNCASFPAALSLSAIRFAVTCRTESALTVLVIEEKDHWPGACGQIHFIIGEKRLEPEISDVCRRAQVMTFCVSYLEKFKLEKNQ